MSTIDLSFDQKTGLPMRTSDWTCSVSASTHKEEGGNLQVRTYFPSLHYRDSMPTPPDDDDRSVSHTHRPGYHAMSLFKDWVVERCLPLQERQTQEYIQNLHKSLRKDMEDHPQFTGMSLTGIKQQLPSEEQRLTFDFCCLIGTLYPTESALGYPPAIEGSSSCSESDSGPAHSQPSQSVASTKPANDARRKGPKRRR